MTQESAVQRDASARLTIDPEGRFRDDAGRVVTLRGVNVGGRSKWSPFLPFPLPASDSVEALREAAAAFVALGRAWGLNCVRLTFSWEAIEPERGRYDERYLQRLDLLVDACWDAGWRVLLDFHQDVFAGAFSGDGFPAWCVPEADRAPPRHDDPQWFLGYVANPGVRRSFQRFWDNEEGLRDALLAMWQRVASRYRHHPGVLGFEIINEPGWGEAEDIVAWKQEVLTPFHEEVARLLRAIAPDKLVFWDGPGIDALYARHAIFPRPQGEGLVFAPHLYDAGLINGQPWTGERPEPAIEHLAAFRRDHATPVLIGEFGVADGAQGWEEWLTRAMDAIDAHQLSCTLWEFSRNEELWNGEDLSVVDAAGNERAVLDVFVRPWLRALAGSEPHVAWIPQEGRLHVRWLSAGGTTEIVLPERCLRGQAPSLSVVGEGVTWRHEAARQTLFVTVADAGDATPPRPVDLQVWLGRP
mgnify:CR=1 FL=1